MPRRLFDEFLDCRLRHSQNGRAETIAEKIKAVLGLVIAPRSAQLCKGRAQHIASAPNRATYRCQ
jgi:hypothetical protein